MEISKKCQNRGNGNFLLYIKSKLNVVQYLEVSKPDLCVSYGISIICLVVILMGYMNSMFKKTQELMRREMLLLLFCTMK